MVAPTMFNATPIMGRYNPKIGVRIERMTIKTKLIIKHVFPTIADAKPLLKR